MSLPSTSHAEKKRAPAESCELESLPWLISNLRRQVRDAVQTQDISQTSASKNSPAAKNPPAAKNSPDSNESSGSNPSTNEKN